TEIAGSFRYRSGLRSVGRERLCPHAGVVNVGRRCPPSALCALAPSVGWLIAARVLQGIAAAIVTPSSLALIGVTYPKNERNRAIGVWAAASALTTAGGPVLGGWLVETFDWQSVFWINPPMALVVVALLASLLLPAA